MRDSLDARLAELRAKPSAARFAEPTLKGDGGRAVISDERRAAGQIFARAVNRSGLEPKDIAPKIRRSESSGVSRLTSGFDITETVARWLLDPVLRVALIEALAELPGDAATARTVIEIEREKAGAA